GVLDALRLSGRAGRIEDEERMLGVYVHRVAAFRLSLGDVVPPLVARRLHRHIAARALVDDDVLDVLAATHAERFVHYWLERYLLPTAELPIRRDHRNGAGVDDAFLQALRREAAKYHRMRGADPRTCLHRHD